MATRGQFPNQGRFSRAVSAFGGYVRNRLPSLIPTSVGNEAATSNAVNAQLLLQDYFWGDTASPQTIVLTQVNAQFAQGSVVSSANITLAEASATLTQQATTTSATYTATLSQASATIAQQAPTVTLGAVTSTLSEASATIAAQAPTIQQRQDVTQASATLTQQDPVVVLGTVTSSLAATNVTLAQQTVTTTIGALSVSLSPASASAAAQATTTQQRQDVTQASATLTQVSPTQLFRQDLAVTPVTVTPTGGVLANASYNVAVSAIPVYYVAPSVSVIIVEPPVSYSDYVGLVSEPDYGNKIAPGLHDRTKVTDQQAASRVAASQAFSKVDQINNQLKVVD